MNLLFKPRELRSALKKPLKENSTGCSFQELVEQVHEMLQEYTGTSVMDTELEETLRKNQEEYRRLLSKSIRTCCTGNDGARETVKEMIQEYLLEERNMNQQGLWQLIPFNQPEEMTPWQQMETMIYCLDKQKKEQGFALLCETYHWGKRSGTAGDPKYVVTEQTVRQTYAAMAPELTFQDELAVTAQILFASTVGLGVIDTLNHQKGYIEEIQVGMSGRSEQRYDYREELEKQKSRVLFSRDGVHILVHGSTVWLQFLSFGTEEELQRVLRNLIKDSQSGELTKNHPMIVVDTVDGRRVSVSRPPMTDAWVGLIRKFDTVQEVSLEKLYHGCPEEELLCGLLRWLVKSGRNIAITGEMASGKTTLFRACLAEARKELNIRVIEADSFELNVRGFLPEANSMTMRVTEQTPAEEVLAFARKTTGQIFAVGEINSAAVAAMAMDLSKIASQLFFSAHYVTTEHMIADFVNAKLCIGGYSEEVLAEMDVVRCLGFDVHLKARQGRRYVQYINEVIPEIRKEDRKGSTYQIRSIYRYDEEKEQGELLNLPGPLTYENAGHLLEREEYQEFCRFFELWKKEEAGEQRMAVENGRE
ncbi:MAG: Flp pilus assembly complex ATPase component TadA [Lachnospiraceae bacterium]|nr:Flp pilus assembly complex ATPase component TadA [Lachnospiraceae bacterium]